MTDLAGPLELAPAAAGRVGPNAVIQTLAAVSAIAGEEAAQIVARRAGCAAALTDPPSGMVGETQVRRLFRAVRDILPDEADAIMALSGRLTGEYILAHRIPGPAKALLRRLPRRLAAVALARSIRRSAWTFAGSGAFSLESSQAFTIAANPLAVGPGCPWHRSVFRTLFADLVDRDAAVSEPECCGRGHPACRFEIVM